MMNENDEILMSQLADGELSSDQTNELLLDVLDSSARRETLKELLRLRQATLGWRTRSPQRPVMVVSQRPQSARRSRVAWRAGGLAVAACVGGLLVLTGIWAAGWFGVATRTTQQANDSPRPGVTPAVAQVSSEQMQQVANVFALHESVAGPLAWYAADDQNIRLASASGTEAGQQLVGVLLKLESATPGVPARTLVIVCRNDQPAVIDLPAESADKAGLRLYMTPRTVNGKVDMQYAIAVDGKSPQTPSASLSGQRRLGPVESSLGQLAMGDKTLNIEASAWPIRQEQK